MSQEMDVVLNSFYFPEIHRRTAADFDVELNGNGHIEISLGSESAILSKDDAVKIAIRLLRKSGCKTKIKDVLD